MSSFGKIPPHKLPDRHPYFKTSLPSRARSAHIDPESSRHVPLPPPRFPCSTAVLFPLSMRLGDLVGAHPPYFPFPILLSIFHKPHTTHKSCSLPSHIQHVQRITSTCATTNRLQCCLHNISRLSSFSYTSRISWSFLLSTSISISNAGM